MCLIFFHDYFRLKITRPLGTLFNKEELNSERRRMAMRRYKNNMCLIFFHDYFRLKITRPLGTLFNKEGLNSERRRMEMRQYKIKSIENVLLLKSATSPNAQDKQFLARRSSMAIE
jgi:hypothetical protein